jgi:hypothetical protein
VDAFSRLSHFASSDRPESLRVGRISCSFGVRARDVLAEFALRHLRRLGVVALRAPGPSDWQSDPTIEIAYAAASMREGGRVRLDLAWRTFGWMGRSPRSQTDLSENVVLIKRDFMTMSD